ncbi:MAG: hypothetical protein M3R64_00305 [Pseudomonadota bacterium]|nr:hypothetical protein [Pseudomonadota bacterium]
MTEDISGSQARADEAWLDADFREMNLSYAEKSGLQIYRNYTLSFEEHNIERFRDALNNEEHDFSALVQLTHLLVHEDIRFTPVILCGYADDALKSVFMDVLPAEVPGGRSSMLSGYGPLSTLSERIRLAHAFTVLSQDLMTQLDAVRKVRNRVSHDWNLKSAIELLDSISLDDLYPIDHQIAEHSPEVGATDVELDRSSSLRTRLIWLAGRLTYESAAFNKAKRARLSPMKALYGNGSTNWLAEVAQICANATRSVSLQAAAKLG